MAISKKEYELYVMLCKIFNIEVDVHVEIY